MLRVAPVNLKILAYTLEVEGHDSRELLRRCGLCAMEELPEDGEWVPLAQFDHMMAAAIEITGDPSFGLIAGKSLALMKYGAITPVVLSTPSLRALLGDVGHFAPLVVPRAEIELVEKGAWAQLQIHPVVQGGASGRFRTELVATSAVQMLRLAGATPADIQAVHFPHAAPADQLSRYVATFGPHLSFSSKACAVHFDARLLDAALPGHDPVAYLSARTRAEALLAALRAGNDLAEQVRSALLLAFPDVPPLPVLAARLGANDRTVRRQLAALGTSYADLVQECQRLTAERLLAEGRMPLKQIADALGFASVHSFHRAFRRWSGQTPATWRSGGPMPGVTSHAGLSAPAQPQVGRCG